MDHPPCMMNFMMETTLISGILLDHFQNLSAGWVTYHPSYMMNFILEATYLSFQLCSQLYTLYWSVDHLVGWSFNISELFFGAFSKSCFWVGGGSSSLTIHRRDITPLCSALGRAVAADTKPLVPPHSTLQTIVMWSEKYYGKMRFSLEALICLSILIPMHWF